MVDYGSEEFLVSFEGYNVGDQISVSIEEVTTTGNITTSNGVRNRKNRKATGVTVKFEHLDFAENEEIYFAIKDMLLVRQRVESCTVMCQKRLQNGREYIESTTYLSGSVDVSDSWGLDDDWKRSTTVNFDKKVINDPIFLN